jgi:uncharacterized protein YbaR (Trm112 family)
MIDAELLNILCCPETHQSLAVAEPALIERLNALVAAGQLKNRAGQAVTDKLEGGLLRRDGQWLYPIREEIPVLLIEEAIPVPSAAPNPAGPTG